MDLSAYRVPAFTVLLFAVVIVFLYSTLLPDLQDESILDEIEQPVDEDRPDVVAYVNGDPIFVSDVLALSENKNLVLSGEEIFTGQAIVHELVEELIRQKLLADEARRLDLVSERSVQSAVRISQRQVLSDIVLGQQVREQMSEALLQELYRDETIRLQLTEEIRARHILVDSQDQADLLVVKLNAGVPFDEIAEKFSKDTATAVKGGDLGWFTRGDMLSKFSEVAFSLPVGSRSEPFRTQYGWHIVLVEDRRQSDNVSYDEMRPKLLRHRTYLIIQDLISELRKEGKVEYVLSAPSDG